MRQPCYSPFIATIPLSTTLKKSPDCYLNTKRCHKLHGSSQLPRFRPWSLRCNKNSCLFELHWALGFSGWLVLRPPGYEFFLTLSAAPFSLGKQRRTTQRLLSKKLRRYEFSISDNHVTKTLKSLILNALVPTHTNLTSDCGVEVAVPQTALETALPQATAGAEREAEPFAVLQVPKRLMLWRVS